jgi:hypothetical protein
MSKAERAEWAAMEEKKRKAKLWLQKWPLLVRMLNRMVGIVDKRFCVQPTPGFWHNG